MFIYRDGYPLSFKEWIEKSKSLISGNSFKFISIASEFDGDWDNIIHGKLWIYNLNYMDYLCQEGITSEIGIYWIKRFIKELPDNKIGKEPYTIAIRNINWVKFQSKFRKTNTDADNKLIDGTLYAQYKILLKNIEYHLMGNHLIEDGFSLLFGGFYFRDLTLCQKGYNIIEKELAEQILNDGGHFELSPMYHQLILDHLLDCLNLLLKNENIFESQLNLLDKMSISASKMLGWLDKMTFRNGVIPLLNDSSLSVAPTSNQLNEYARRLNISKQEVCLDDSGYRKYCGKYFECFIDIGEIGPDYIPGHAHSDTFNFVMNVNDLPFIVDTGVSTYDKNERRLYERSTCSHNTVSVDGCNSSDVWDGFRVGERAHVTILLDTKNKIIAEHNGFNSLKVKHRRHFIFTDDSLCIKDEISGGLSCTAHLHFHPDRAIAISANKIKVDNCIIELTGFQSYDLVPFEFYPKFNEGIKSMMLVGVFVNSSTINIIVNES